MIQKVTLLGHKDHGKSTLIGNLLILTGAASKERIDEAKRVSRELGRKFEPGFILDAFSEERKDGLTIDTTRTEITYKGIGLELIDVPGHEELIKNMLSGASNATFALLVVSAKKGEGITPQTKRHVFLAKMLGIDKIVVAVNKMDTVSYSKKEFDSIAGRIMDFLASVGFKRNNMSFVPISAYGGENLVKHSSKIKWYAGKPLLELVYEMARRKEKMASQPLVILQDYIGNKMIGSKVVGGSFSTGDTVHVLPDGTTAKILKIAVGGRAKKHTNAGESAAMLLSKGVAEPKGKILCKDHMPKVSDKIEARVFLTRRATNRVSIVINGREIKGSMHIRKAIDPTTGNAEIRRPLPLDAAEVTLRLDEKVTYEDFGEVKEMGRFVLYSKKFLGIGVIGAG